MREHFHWEITNCKTNEHESKFSFWDNKLLIYGQIRDKIVKRLSENSLGQRKVGNIHNFELFQLNFLQNQQKLFSKLTEETFFSSLIANIYPITAQRRTQDVKNSLCKFITGTL